MGKNGFRFLLTHILLTVNLYGFEATRNAFTNDDDNMWVKKNDMDSPKLIQQPAGLEVRLRCSIRRHHVDNMGSSVVSWYFKSCGEGYNRTSCYNINENQEENEWKNLECDGKPCKITLILKNPEENDSGLYRCEIHPYRPDEQTTLEIKVVKTFQLDVINATVAPPELLDNLPANTTASFDSQVVLQCRIYSKVPPSIKWFRKQDSNSHINLEAETLNPRSIQYFENTYELVESAGEKGLSEDTYLSKLIINNVSERDAGMYVCIGINYRGFKMREAFLNVAYPEDLEMSSGSGYLHLFVLFLMPLGLAIIPLLVWTGFTVMRRRNRKKNVKTSNNYIYDDHIYEKVNVI